jgi:hypothetical protein
MAGLVDLYMTMLFAYQGMGNLVTLTKPGDPNTVYYNALIDFGSTSYYECDETVSFVGNYLTNGGTKNAVLDMVVISHKDNDHWSLLGRLLEYLNHIGKSLIIKKLIFGGYYATYSKNKDGENIIDILYKCVQNPTVAGNYVWYAAEGSAYAAGPKYAELDNYGGVQFMPVAVNVVASVSKSRHCQHNVAGCGNLIRHGVNAITRRCHRRYHRIHQYVVKSGNRRRDQVTANVIGASPRRAANDCFQLPGQRP